MFFITGDLSVMDEEMLYLMMFNKNLLKNYNLEDPYELVRQGKWTLDKLHSMAQGVNKDLDGNGIFDENDLYGFANDYATAHIHFYAAGGTTAKLDKNGIPYLTLMSERNQEVIERIASLYHDKNSVINASELKGTWTTLRVMRETDKTLFSAGCVYNIPYYRNMTSDYGILPLPKHSEDQENYCHLVASNGATAFTIPISLTGEAVERTCVILAALSANSEEAVAAHYEINLKSKNARDVESQEMLEIIFNTKYYDLAKVYRWTAYANTLETKVIVAAIKEPGTFASKYEANKTAAETAMKATYEFFK
ncbi:MAG: hypothetical protein E7662_04040 [Ruminococcaceae bacterium]|nr:hypothetical protein [Oscillospiraceae bacterium]